MQGSRLGKLAAIAGFVLIQYSGGYLYQPPPPSYLTTPLNNGQSVTEPIPPSVQDQQQEYLQQRTRELWQQQERDREIWELNNGVKTNDDDD